MVELLAPAGSPQAVIAAVQSGADAIYLGYGDFNARRNAKNFSLEELATAVSYCHLRGVHVFLTLNILVTDRELVQVEKVVKEVAEVGIDAIIVQDLGVARLIRQVCPDIDIHGSTQMTVHSLDGVKKCAELGMTRVVLSRELSREAMKYICTHSPIEIEVFVHGALCMCYSGQCLFSSVIGGRSANRGLCAQPCRLKYGFADKPDSNPLSMKDMSMANHLMDLKKIGVSCLKIEGRMKRPEYVGVVTGIYARALKEGRQPTEEEHQQLADAFSREGFTDGYYQDKKGKNMFGIRLETKEPKELFAQVRNAYENGEQPRVPITFYAMIRNGEPVQVGVQDDQGHTVTVDGPVPELARNKEVTEEVVEIQLSRTGGTTYRCEKIRAIVEPGLSVPVSVLNALRREVLEELTAQRSVKKQVEIHDFHAGVRYENRREKPLFTASLRRIGQLSNDLVKLEPAVIYIPLEEAGNNLDRIKEVAEMGKTQLAVSLPKICWDHELDKVKEHLANVFQAGVTHALVGNVGLVQPALDAGFKLRGDYGLGVFNSQSIKEYKRMGFQSVTASMELKFAQIRDLSKPIELEVVGYGRLPLMITETCVVQGQTNRCSCDNNITLTDRKGEKFPVMRSSGHRNEIFNSKKLFLADKEKDYQKIGAWAMRLMFTTENPRECVQVLERYLGLGPYEPNDFTRGLYYRDVE